jgi:hypothetical protein
MFFRPGRFVLRPLSDDHNLLSIIESCELLSQIEELNSHARGWIVAMKQSHGDAKVDWEALHAALGQTCQILPILCNDKSSDRYPTGMLTVRFKAPQTLDTLQEMAQAHDLILERQTPYILVQARFSLISPQTMFLPEVAQRVYEDKEVEAVWMDADSAFVRLWR